MLRAADTEVKKRTGYKTMIFTVDVHEKDGGYEVHVSHTVEYTIHRSTYFSTFMCSAMLMAKKHMELVILKET